MAAAGKGMVLLAALFSAVAALPVETEKPHQPHDRASDHFNNALWEWGREENIWGVDHLAAATVGSPPHRGLRLTRAMAAGDTVISVKYDNIISSRSLLTNETMQPVLARYEKEPNSELLYWLLNNILKPRLTLMMMLERKKGVNSKWYHYIRSLPSQFSMVSSFSPSELDELRGVVEHEHNLKETAGTSINELRREFELFFPELHTNFPDIFGGNFTHEDYLWARHVINTRCFSFTRDDGVPDLGMIPIADMANHGNVPVSWRSGAGSVDLYTNVSFAAGDEFLLNYGKRSNAYLLEHYGFILANNTLHEDLCEAGDLSCKVKLLQKYPTSVLHDLEQLRNGTGSFNTQNAVHLRLEERLHLLGLDDEANNLSQFQ